MLCNTVSYKDVPSIHMQSGLDIIEHQLQYGLQQIQQTVYVCQNSRVHHKGHNSEHRQHPYSATGATSATDSGRIRRRVTVACDQCNQQRTKCDGQSPCARCFNFDFGCTYVRKRKKRGKVSRKDLAQRAAAAAANQQESSAYQELDEHSPMELSVASGSSVTSPEIDTGDFKQPHTFRHLDLTSTELNRKSPTGQQSEGKLDSASLEGEDSTDRQTHMTNSLQIDQIESPISLSLNGYSSTSEYRSVLYRQMIESNSHSTFTSAQMNASCYNNSPYNDQAWNSIQYLINTQGLLYQGPNPSSGFAKRSDAASPDGWITSSSPSHQ